MNFRISNDPPAPQTPEVAPPAVEPAVQLELDRLDDVEGGYVKYLDGNLSPQVEAQVANHAALIHVKPEDGVDAARVAWAVMRAGEPQPEDHRASTPIERDYMLAKNVAFARALDRARRHEGDQSSLSPARDPVAPPAPSPAAPPAPATPAPAAPSAPSPAAISLEPLGMDELREKARTTPAIKAQVDEQVGILRSHPDLATDEQRSRAFEEARRAMAAAAAGGLKADERKLRIQVLALDTLRMEPPRARPLPTEEPTPKPPQAPKRPLGRDAPLGPVVAVEQAPPPAPTAPSAPQQRAPDPPQPKVPEEQAMKLERPPQAPPLKTAVEPRPLPTPSLDPTDPAIQLPDPARFVVVEEPTLPDAQKRSVSDLSLEPESAPIKLRQDLGLPPVQPRPPEPQPDLDGPTVRNVPPPISPDGPTLRQPRPASDELQPPIREALAPEPDTNKARRGPPAAAKPAVPTPPEHTVEVRPDDLERDPQLAWDDTDANFRTFFKRVDLERGLQSNMRDDQHALRRRRESLDIDDRMFVEAVDARAEQFRRGQDNNDLSELDRQYKTLVDEERNNAELTGNKFAVDRAALAMIRTEVITREADLADRIAADRFAEIETLSAPEQLALRREAAVLLSTIDKDYEESPYDNRDFVRTEIVRREDDDDYARALAIIRTTNRTPSNYLAYLAETDDDLRARATARTTSLLEKNPLETDDMLRRELAEARVSLTFANASGNAIAIARATDKAAELAFVYDSLPRRRSLEVNTPAARVQPIR